MFYLQLIIPSVNIRAKVVFGCRCSADVSGIMFPGPIAGHVGDGNFHCLMVVDPNDPVELEKVHLFTERLAR